MCYIFFFFLLKGNHKGFIYMTTLSSTPHHDPLPIVPLFLSSKESLSPNLMNAPNDSTLQVWTYTAKVLICKINWRWTFYTLKLFQKNAKKEGCCYIDRRRKTFGARCPFFYFIITKKNAFAQFSQKLYHFRMYLSYCFTICGTI